MRADRWSSGPGFLFSTVGVARPAWRLLVDGARDEPLALVATAVALAALGAVGWLLRARRPDSRRRGRGRG